MQAIERIAVNLPEDAERSLFATTADAFLDMARASLQNEQVGAPNNGTNNDNYQVVVHVDAAALDNTGGKSDLPLPTVKPLCCDGAIIGLIEMMLVRF